MIVHSARAHRSKVAIVDSLGTTLTFGELLLRALVLGRVLERELGDCRYVGVWLPPTAAAAVANIALTLMGRVPVNLNYTTGQEVLDASIVQCGMSHVITSRKALDRFSARPQANLVMLEEVPKKVTLADKAFAGMMAQVVPFGMLGSALPGLRGDRRDDTATIIFTSGSTGQPKGVILTHGNVLANIQQIDLKVKLIEQEVILGILPFFHSFGFTVTLWTALCLGKKTVYHINPQDARTIGNLVQEHRATMLAASPTFMRFYVRKCDREQFATVRLPILGAEKLKPELAREIRDKLGIEPLEGYGCTETGPVVAVNTPDMVHATDGREVAGNRPGTVGTLMPGTAIKTTDLDTGEDLAAGLEGVVHVRGPQIMRGYLNQPEKTAEVLRDGWYNTGDIGRIDDDGFLLITGRISRFSKVAGEMVPHERIESAILALVTMDDPVLAVTSVPCPKRGERLIVFHNGLGLTPQEIHRRLNEGALPKLWVPSPEDFFEVEAIPTLGSGKVDLKALRTLAEQRVGGS